jgi:hypothetical protein
MHTEKKQFSVPDPETLNSAKSEENNLFFVKWRIWL